ncbi:MAG: glycosyltransferase [Thermoleophilia bacterium]|nr:glycosyltransferase [Thermoleophilia bacterium]
MSDALAIAIVCPTPWPPGDDLAWAVRAQADALAAAGHRVTVIAPGLTRASLAAGRSLLARAEGGDAAALLAAPGAPLVVCAGRAIRAGRARHVAGPLDLAAGLEAALRHGPFHVVHVHEPLAPSPALTALRHTPAATVATFHRPLKGVAFLGPLVQRAIGRVDVRIAGSRIAQRAAQQILPGEDVVLPAAAADPGPPAGNGIAIVARGRDRAGLRFALAVVRGLPPEARRTVTVMGPREAPWRTRAAVPKALRGVVEVVEDSGPEAWRRTLAAASVVLLGTAEDVDGPVARMAMAGGRVLVAPRGAEADELLRHGHDALVLPPFTRDAWTTAVVDLMGEPGRRSALGAAAAASVPSPAEAAHRLEEVYRRAIARRGHRRSDPGARVVADLRVRPAANADPARLAAACRDAGLDVVAIAAPALEPARRVAAAAPPGLTVIVGQEVASADGLVVGLFLTEEVPAGLSFADTAGRIRAQGGVVVAPHPSTGEVPSAEVLRDLADMVDCFELVTAAAGPAGLEAGRAARRLGIVVSAASVTAVPDALGAVGVSMRPFQDGRDFVEALAEAELVRPRRGRRARRARARTVATDT